MLQSQIPNFATKEFPKDEESYNAQALIRAGFIDKLMSGVYSYLPLGLKVLRRIEKIVRDHMDMLGSEILMPAIHPKKNWMQTDRWNTLDVLFKVVSNDKKEYAIGPTHEEIVVPLASKAIFSYRDLPMYLYQIQTKFRDEPRAKSGLLRGREFIMKDLYSFHTDQEDLKMFYSKVRDEYHKMFNDLGLDAKLVQASGGSFSEFSHEFQVLTKNGEDSIVICKSCEFAQNSEINKAKNGDACPNCGKKLSLENGSEVGNIFELNRKYSDPFNLSYKDQGGSMNPVYMGCYGLGISRVMGVIAEVFHDEKGFVWPKNVAPFDVHLLMLSSNDDKKDETLIQKANEAINMLESKNIEVLFDDRKNVSNGEKLTQADLIGIPVRLIISEKTGDKIEFKKRNEKDSTNIDFEEVLGYILK